MVVVVGLLGMLLAFIGELLGAGAVAALVGLARFGGAVLMFALFLQCEISESIVLGFRIRRLLVVEGCREETLVCWPTRAMNEECGCTAAANVRVGV